MLTIPDNNFYFDLPLNFPLKKVVSGAVPPIGERARLSTPIVYKESLLCPIIGALKCLNMETLELKWTLADCGGRVKIDSGFIFVAVEDNVACVDPNSAEILWRTEDREFLHTVYGEHVYTQLEQEPYPTRCRNKTSGELVWESQIGNSEHLVFSEKTFVSRGKTYHGIDIKTGKVLWSFDKNEWIDRNILSLNLDYPEGYSDFEKHMMQEGPLIDHILYVMPKVGSIAAIDISNGSLKGTVVIPTGSIEAPYNSRQIYQLVHRDGVLYFHRVGFQQKSSMVFGALDTKSGEVLFSKEHFHQSTGGTPGTAIMVDRYYIVPCEANYLIVFDTEQREVVWTYQTKRQERNMLRSMPVPFENGIIFNDGAQSLYKFQG